jgi:F-type H+-transporting ATPase subunit b
MPQLDASTFPQQLFWLAVTFILLYLVMWKVVMPRIAAVLQNRQERIDDDLERAQKLRDDAAAVLETYEKTIADGRLQAQTILRDAAAAAAAEADRRQAALREKLARQTAEAEARIRAASDEAMSNIRSVAVEAAQAAVSRLGGSSVSRDDAERAVADAMAEDR